MTEMKTLTVNGKGYSLADEKAREAIGPLEALQTGARLNLVAAVNETARQAPAIVCSTSGSVLAVADSADRPLQGLKLFGKTVQGADPTPDGPQALTNVGSSGSVGLTAAGTNILDIATAVQYHNNAGGATNTVYSCVTTETGVKIEMIQPISTNWLCHGVRIGETEKLRGKTITVSAKYTTNRTDDYAIANMAFSGTDREGGNHPDAYWGSSGHRQAYAQSQKTGVITCTVGDEITEKYVAVGLYIGYGGAWEAGDWCRWSDIQVQIGDTATAYEPYQGQTVTVETPGGLPGIPVKTGGNYTDEKGQMWLCDEIDPVRGVYVQRVRRRSYRIADMDNDYEDAPGWKNSGIKEDYPMVNAHVSSLAIPIMSNVATSPGAFGFATNSTDVLFLTKTHFGLTQSQWKAQYPDLTVQIQYALPAPIETAVEPAALHGNKPCTTVMNDAGADMAMEYVADTKAYIDRRLPR